MAHKMKYTNGKKADVSAFPFKTQENVIDNTIDNPYTYSVNGGRLQRHDKRDMGSTEGGKNDKLIELLEKENDLSKEIQQTKKEMSTNNENI